MMAEMMNRRRFISKLSIGALLALSSVNVRAKLNNTTYWAGTAKQGNDYWLMFFDELGQVLRRIKLPSRAHGLQQSAKGQLIICGRRPGTWMLLLQHLESKPQWLRVAENRPLSGHCCFSADGNRFFSAENDFEAGRGIIGVWDAHSGERLNEWPSQGIGAHEIQVSSHGTHLWVANGGILTHPNKGREKLNLDTMASNISYLSLTNGALIKQYTIDEQLLSLRHIAVNQNNQVGVACQYQGPEYQRKNLLLLISEGQINYLACDPKVTSHLNNYLGSVTFDISGEWIAASSPRGNRVIIWHLVEGRDAIHSDTLIINDACGLSASHQAGGFIISTGMGYLYHYQATTKHTYTMASGTKASGTNSEIQLSWDNHLANFQLVNQ
jgi:hypothetical protein